MATEISIIAAVDRKGGIGKWKELQWHQGADLRRFRQLTEGHTVVMGRVTYESLKTVSLPGRKLIVLTTKRDYKVDHPDVTISPSLVTAILEAQAAGVEKLFLAGGEDVYALGFGFADVAHITEIDTLIDKPHAVFPLLGLQAYYLTETRGPYKADEDNDFDYTFKTYTRRKTHYDYRT